jgi:hypothetical protein
MKMRIPIIWAVVVVCTNIGGDAGAVATDQAAARLIQEYLPETTP